ncbi:MFS transporter [Bacillus sp. FJAT-49736]|uniref:MFS transporter n=1 Tax=Bacillus sp. FJAT-49736 TaxID=2833582 RepID=UPI001BCA4924|nr:MFS transporter [Bacillus sp. FJAT-49736]MBS4172931.1 MFS transporter [Bacillus sp. FJAT-49736]
MAGNKGFHTFLFIWGGQLGSLLGSSLTSFALGVYILQKTGSVSNFAITLVCMSVPGLLISPFAGALVDKWSRKGMMLASDCLSGLATLGIFSSVFFTELQLWHIYTAVIMWSISGAMQFPAYQAIVAQIVEKKHLGRANGLIQMSDAASSIVAPPIAGILLPIIHIQGILLMDFFSFFIAIFSLLLAKIPPFVASELYRKKQSLLLDIKDGIQYLRFNKALLWFLMYFSMANFILGFENVLLQPLILSLSDAKTLGFVMSCFGLSMVLGGLVMSAWGGPKRKTRGVFGFGLISSVFFTFIWGTNFIPVMCVFIFISFFFLPFGNTCSQVIWQSKVDPGIQGRVFALRRMIAMSLMPISYLLSAPLLDHVFTPFMSPPAIGSKLLGGWLGVGENSGIRLFLMTLGLIWIGTTIILSFHKEIKLLDDDSKIEEETLATTV